MIGCTCSSQLLNEVSMWARIYKKLASDDVVEMASIPDHHSYSYGVASGLYIAHVGAAKELARLAQAEIDREMVESDRLAAALGGEEVM